MPLKTSISKCFVDWQVVEASLFTMVASNQKQKGWTKTQDADGLKFILKEDLAKLLEILGIQTGKLVQEASEVQIQQTSSIFYFRRTFQPPSHRRLWG